MSKNSPKISIIIPVYNAEKFINQTVDSVLCQTYDNIEILLVDNKSKDKSLEIIKAYEKKDKKIKVYQENDKQSVGAARNLGIKKATGEYITFIDADDIAQPFLVEKLIDNALLNKTDIVYGLSARKGSLKTYGVLFKCNKPEDFKKNFNKISVIHGVLYKKSFLDNNNITYHEGVLTGQDWVFNTTCIFNTDKISKEPTIVYTYIKQDGSLSTVFNEKFLTKTVLSEAQIKLFKEKNLIGDKRYNRALFKTLFKTYFNTRRQLRSDLSARFKNEYLDMIAREGLTKTFYIYKTLFHIKKNLLNIVLLSLLYIANTANTAFALKVTFNTLAVIYVAHILNTIRKRNKRKAKK
ncbi:MAG: glycosyltransferase [Alphaproteobacteria bacterium]|jgi:glycosyltransferase involved in cell wall biosynthesis|nr:glycosyltransferase [Alphaproteobacteria bacterium]